MPVDTPASKPVLEPEKVLDKKDVKKIEKKEEMSEEDIKLKSTLDLLVTVITEQQSIKQSIKEYETVQKNAIESLRKEIKSSTSSMTSIPKPLKFLRAHFSTLKNAYESMNDNDNKKSLADILSILSMTQSTAERWTLMYKLNAGNLNTVGSWGHEYVRHLAGEIGAEYEQRNVDNKSVLELDTLVDEILPFFIEHNAEYDAIDLLTETSQLLKLTKYFSKDNYIRICLYLLRCCDYIIEPEEQMKMLIVTFNGYKQFGQYADALRVAIKMNNKSLIEELYNASSNDTAMQLQLSHILGSMRFTNLPESIRENETYMNAIGNSTLNGYYLQLASDLDVKEAKTPEDIYKSHLEEGGPRRVTKTTTGSTGVDSAKQNLASTFVNAFVNCGFGKDLLITPEGSDWLYKNKSQGMLSATASLGFLNLWDVDSGFSAVDRYSFSAQSHIKAGAALAHGLLSSGITSDMDAAQALLTEHLESKDNDLKLSAILGLGLAYAGSARDDILELLVPLIVESGQSMEIVSHACLALGLVFTGTANEDISGSIIESFLDRSSTDLNDSTSRLMCLGMGLLFLGVAENAEGALAAIAVIEHPINKYLTLTVNTCAYAGVNSVLEIQKLLTVLTEHINVDEEEKKEAPAAGTAAATTPAATETPKDPLKGIHQEVAVLGIAMISMGEELGQEMALRSLDHVLQYGEVNVRRVVPLALGLLSISNPRLTVMDTLSKLSHDSDQYVSQNAILGMGFLGAGTNNSRLASSLRALASYYSKEPNHLFLVRIAQGLLHLGKGLLTLSPVQSDGLLVNKVSVAGLLTVMHACLDTKNTILSKRHYLLYAIVTAIRPRMLMTIDESGKSIPISVRVGQKVDTVGQVGKPKTITGFQAHKTPVLLSVGERAELATDEYLTCTQVLEHIVVVKKNPDYKPPTI